eukprot:6395446-Ditylum_brightwellii.AAC.1
MSQIKYFNGTFAMHHGLTCKVFREEFGDVQRDNIVVPSIKKPVYIYLGNVTDNCKVGLCQKHYTFSMKTSNIFKTRFCITCNN